MVKMVQNGYIDDRFNAMGWPSYNVQQVYFYGVLLILFGKLAFFTGLGYF